TWLSQAQIISAVSAALVIPYLIFSPLSGKLAVLYSHKKVFKIMKLIEFPIMFVACLAFYYQWIVLAIGAVLLMGVQSCLYSPAKYSLIKDIGGGHKVSFGSGMIEAMAFLGVLLGTVVASVLSDHYHYWVVASMFIIIALIAYGFVSILHVTEDREINAPISSINPLKFLNENYRFARRYKSITTCILGYSVFWLIAGMVQMNLIIHCSKALHLSNSMTGLVMSVAAAGIISGCSLVGKVSKEQVKTRFIFIGLGGMFLTLSSILFFNPPVVIFTILIFLFAFFGGFFQVPCLAFIQKSDIGRKLGDMMAYLNLLTFIFVLIGTALFSITTLLTHENSLAVFAVILIVVLLSTFYFLIHVPHFWKLNKNH
ncbi:MAG: MFS transporter, partial [Bacteroidales bacterium]